MWATADSGVGTPVEVLILRSPICCGVRAKPGRASRITRYWLVSAKMVETMRWPNAE